MKKIPQFDLKVLLTVQLIVFVTIIYCIIDDNKYVARYTTIVDHSDLIRLKTNEGVTIFNHDHLEDISPIIDYLVKSWKNTDQLILDVAMHAHKANSSSLIGLAFMDILMSIFTIIVIFKARLRKGDDV